jgi:hypothetical protein
MLILISGKDSLYELQSREDGIAQHCFSLDRSM